jgi:dTDP-glucose 4,6-dehydratase
LTRYIAVTGCAGFIGKHLTRKLLERGDYVYGVDSLTYAASPDDIRKMGETFPHQFSFIARDVRELGRWPDVDAILHLAAETHVDNSFAEASRFVETNVNGTLHLLEMTRAKSQHGMPHFYHISTDEVYGPIEEGKADTDAPLRPTSPYAASKAAADLLVQAWGKTFTLPYTIIRPTNVYGHGQYPEKLIPKAVRSLMLGRPIPVHGDGSMTRQWLHVEDLADAIMLVLDTDPPPIVNVSGNTEAAVGEIACKICFLMEPERDAYTLIQTGYERPAVDVRYSVEDSWIRQAGWKPRGNFWKDLPALVAEESKRFRF